MNPARALWLILALLFTNPVWAFQTKVVSIPSAAMHQSFDATVVLPEQYAHARPGQRFPVVYLLHGSGGDYTDWTANAHIGRLADRYHVILVMPDGGHESWYIDSPVDPRSRYETYVGKEVVAYVDAHFHTIATKEGRAITGLSMGGFGALSIALDRPNEFGAVGSISGAVDPRNCEDEPGIDGVFGDPARHQAFWDSKAIVASAQSFKTAHIDLTIDCGVNDSLVESNRTLHERLVALGVPHDYAERPGGHTWAYWSNAIQYQVLFFSTSFRRHGFAAGIRTAQA
ncbi:alpha/beta hydrolase [Paraburkholderia caballeronis]|uniref:S-formylglutathione hydrolase FrmB n=1 Tax=Paraburkholderia caballeronis TaxID=416943 RepID=A0A1H7UH12_9BURK|nr:alpha/beta hydrolase family protein [Paraburkholderia caballeronis]PXW17531.1 S-formylglutathione hydrolase FrmB [Paraburkholderia caballeronis]PXW95120.1 S-formylglutathione hydrolase FrmB [Paraburkholderia caballeronis]RAJ90966.1 S-formylglutathione hydrolase FrmB [Paraburkholderia caballeronis]TDV07814.1 S-formylglutathione hydrolase FrmB [Paraburkholderia caballeronis]TDV11177.1 S-formylglutathione hydrolase FrmB [Paraburkholderia caballeronis]